MANVTLVLTMLQNIQEHTLYFMGVRVDNVGAEVVLETVHAVMADHVEKSTKRVFFTNVHTIHLANLDPRFRECVNSADIVLPDGSGLQLAARVFGMNIKENLNGTDFVPRLLRYAEAMGRTVYLLGASPDTITPCRDKLAERYPDLRIVGYHHGYFAGNEENSIIADINARGPDIVLVALGSPRQEEWITAHLDVLNARVCFAVGGLFDFMAGTIPRAPEWMRKIGCEWVYRFLQDPRTKWRRVCVEIPLFLARILANKTFSSHQQGFVSREVALR